MVGRRFTQNTAVGWPAVHCSSPGHQQAALQQAELRVLQNALHVAVETNRETPSDTITHTATHTHTHTHTVTVTNQKSPSQQGPV